MTLSDTELDQVIQTLGLLKGHSFKFRKGVEAARKGGEGAPAKKPKTEEAKEAKKSKVEEPKKPGPKGKVPLAKDVERLVSRLEEIEQLRGEVFKAADVILSLDLERFRQGLAQVEFVQNSLRMTN